MFKESFPVIDPLISGHRAADKLLQKEEQKKLEKQADEAASLNTEVKTEEEVNREEIYEKDPEEEWYKK